MTRTAPTGQPAEAARTRCAAEDLPAVRRHHPRLARARCSRLRSGRLGEQAHDRVGVVGQHPAHRGGVAGVLVAQAEAGAERYRVSQQAQRVPPRAHLDREQPARLRPRRRRPGRRPAARPGSGWPPERPHRRLRARRRSVSGRQQGPQPAGRLVVRPGRAGHSRPPAAVRGAGLRRGSGGRSSGRGRPRRRRRCRPAGRARPPASTRSAAAWAGTAVGDR